MTSIKLGVSFQTGLHFAASRVAFWTRHVLPFSRVVLYASRVSRIIQVHSSCHPVSRYKCDYEARGVWIYQDALASGGESKTTNGTVQELKTQNNVVRGFGIYITRQTSEAHHEVQTGTTNILNDFCSYRIKRFNEARSRSSQVINEKREKLVKTGSRARMTSDEDFETQSNVASLVISESSVLHVDIVGGPDGSIDVVGGAASGLRCGWH